MLLALPQALYSSKLVFLILSNANAPEFIRKCSQAASYSDDANHLGWNRRRDLEVSFQWWLEFTG